MIVFYGHIRCVTTINVRKSDGDDLRTHVMCPYNKINLSVYNSRIICKFAY